MRRPGSQPVHRSRPVRFLTAHLPAFVLRMFVWYPKPQAMRTTSTQFVQNFPLVPLSGLGTSLIRAHVLHWILLLSALFSNPAVAQDNCEVIGALPEEAGISGDCSDYWNYVPYDPSYFPVKRVRVMMHVFQHSTATPLNFQAGDEWVLMDAVDRANQGFAGLESMNPNPYGSVHIPDARLQIVLDPAADVRYIVDQQAWQNLPNTSSIFSTWGYHEEPFAQP